MRKTLFLLMVLSLGAAWANGQVTSGDWTYTITEANEATIIAYGGEGGAVAIPTTIDGYPVRMVGGGWPPIFGFPNETVTSITIPDGVTGIGSAAFYTSTALKSAVIAGSVTSIGSAAFDRCNALTNIDVAAANSAYGSIDGVLFDKDATRLITFPAGKAGHYNVPDGVTSIESEAFSGALDLTSVNIPDSVTSIGDRAFSDCLGLTNATIGNGLRRIGVDAFATCENLASVKIPYFTTVGFYAFNPETTGVILNYTLLAQDDEFISALANKIVASLPNNYGLATKGDLATVVSNAVTQIQSDPSSYNLFTLAQNEARYNEGVTAGTSMVTANPASYSLYTADSIMDLRMNGLMVQKQGNNAVVSFQPQTTTNLVNQPFTNNGTAITHEIPMPSNKGFIRIRANPTPVPPQQ